MNIDNVSAQLEALGHPTRLKIFHTLVRVGQPGLSVGQLQKRLEIAGSTMTHHLAKLVAVGMVEQERQGTTYLCRANFTEMRALLSTLADECCVEDQRSRQ